MKEDALLQKEKSKPQVGYIGLKLNNKTDADILSAIGGIDTRQKELKRLIRIGIKELQRRRAIKAKRKNRE